MSEKNVIIFAIEYAALMILGFLAGVYVWDSKILGAFLSIAGTLIVEIAFYLRALAEVSMAV